MIEAKCTRCGETFVPHSTDMEDMIHGQTEAGESCGGIGVIDGQWLSPKPSRVMPLTLSPQEVHGKEYPHCEDPDCEFHHPEVIEWNRK